ncbi:hypothetical protein QBC37DRAFT_433321 [Rhypophila decipiens]|uniref:Nudix hydrolase domain-containing protein n=1 Tax=Rhypophila decipiens TaxID=261697 RepID=A0AAN6XXR3_9PEZI|nr:hypothetical protein QBC37DRAFT_433321 [Rhypophila decipiens]
MGTNMDSPASFTYHPSLERFNISPHAYLAANPSLTDLVVSAVLFDIPLNRSEFADNSNNKPPRTLLIQRAATDGYALYWECPGGGVELGLTHVLSPSNTAKGDGPDIKTEIGDSQPSKYYEKSVQQGHSAGDDTILIALWREVFEETGLRMTRVEALIDDTCEFGNKEGTIKARKFTFLVDFERGQRGEELGAGMGMGIKLNPAEHQDVMWATEEEVVSGEELGSEPGTDGKTRGRKIVFAFDDQRERLIEGFRILNESLST